VDLVPGFVDWVEESMQILIKLQTADHNQEAWNKGPSHGHGKPKHTEEEDERRLDEASHLPREPS